MCGYFGLFLMCLFNCSLDDCFFVCLCGEFGIVGWLFGVDCSEFGCGFGGELCFVFGLFMFEVCVVEDVVVLCDIGLLLVLGILVCVFVGDGDYVDVIDGVGWYVEVVIGVLVFKYGVYCFGCIDDGIDGVCLNV